MRLNSAHVSNPIVFISASIISMGLLMVPAVLALRAKQKRRQLPFSSSYNNDCGTTNSGIEIHCSLTPRNKSILNDAAGLRSEPWGYANPHFASFLAQVRPWLSPFKVSTINRWGKAPPRRIENIRTPSGCEIEVEFISPLLRIAKNPPTVILLHGIAGNSKEIYMEQAAAQIVDKGWEVVILNYSKVSVVDGQSVGGNCLTENCDISFLVSHIRKRHSGFLCCMGFSMGGSKLVTYLLRTKEHCNIDAACTISSPLDFTTNNCTVHQPHGSFVVSMYHLLISTNLKLWILRHYSELKKNDQVNASGPFKRTRSGFMFWFTNNSVPDIDRAITMPLKGLGEGDEHLNEYYENASGVKRLGPSGIKVPYLCITSMNDPFIPEPAMPPKHIINENDNIFLVNTTKLGGHIGYWLPTHGCWGTHAAISFFESVRMHEPKASEQRPRLERMSSSIDAALRLQRTSRTGLTNYFDFIDSDSCSDLMAMEQEDVLGNTQSLAF